MEARPWPSRRRRRPSAPRLPARLYCVRRGLRRGDTPTPGPRRRRPGPDIRSAPASPSPENPRAPRRLGGAEPTKRKGRPRYRRLAWAGDVPRPPGSHGSSTLGPRSRARGPASESSHGAPCAKALVPWTLVAYPTTLDLKSLPFCPKTSMTEDDGGKGIDALLNCHYRVPMVCKLSATSHYSTKYFMFRDMTRY